MTNFSFNLSSDFLEKWLPSPSPKSPLHPINLIFPSSTNPSRVVHVSLRNRDVGKWIRKMSMKPRFKACKDASTAFAHCCLPCWDRPSLHKTGKKKKKIEFFRRKSKFDIFGSSESKIKIKSGEKKRGRNQQWE